MRESVASLLSRRPRTSRYFSRARAVRPRKALRTTYSHISELGVISLDRIREASGHHPRMTALIGAGTAAIAAGTVLAVRYQGAPYADVLSDDQPHRISTLDDLKDDPEALATIQRELLAEWGPFGPQDMVEMQRMVRNAGRMVYVIRFYEDGRLGPPSGVLQTALAQTGGDPERLVERYPSFDAITAGGTWEASSSMRGDTAVLLQITAFGDRSRGVGSRLRDAALYMQPPEVKYALTTTPVPDEFGMESDPESSPAVKFHYRGGARPSGHARGYKAVPTARLGAPAGRQANRDVVFMRYTRLEDGSWDGVRRPDLRLRHRFVDLALPEILRRRRVPAPTPELAEAAA